MAAAIGAGRAVQGAGLDRILPYVLLAPALFLVLGGASSTRCSTASGPARSSTASAGALDSVGLQNYRTRWHDPDFTRRALDDGAASSFLAVTIETVLGLALALLCVRELPLHPLGSARC